MHDTLVEGWGIWDLCEGPMVKTSVLLLRKNLPGRGYACLEFLYWSWPVWHPKVARQRVALLERILEHDRARILLVPIGRCFAGVYIDTRVLDCMMLKT